jgi:hypothetical protein
VRAAGATAPPLSRRSSVSIRQASVAREERRWLYTSSPGVERTHCGTCGSPISYENAREFSIFACTLEDLTLVKPQAHIMVGEMLPWLQFGDDLPCFEKGLHGKPPIGHGPSNLLQVSFDSVKANSEATNADRDNFARGNAAH